MYNKVPKALFNSKALFNPYQYLPFGEVMKWDEQNEKYKANGKNVLVTDEVGVGKTFEIGIILRELLHWNSELAVLILCPVKLCKNWKKELQENFYIGATNYYQEKTFGQITILPYSYFSSGKSKSIAEDIKIENEMKNNKEEVQNFSLPKELSDILPYDILILDEAHYIRNKGKLWGYVNKIIEESERNESKTKIFMTGTPVFNDEEDYSNITELLSKELQEGKVQEFGITKTLQSESNCYDTLLNINIWNYANSSVGSDSVNIKNGITPNDIEKKIINELYATVEKEDNEGNVREVSKYSPLTGFLKRIASSSIYSLNKFVKNREDFNSDILEYEHNFYENYFELNYDDLKIYLEKWSTNCDTKLKALKTLIELEFNKENTNKKAIVFSCFINTCKYLEEQLKENYHVYMNTGETEAKNVENAKAMFEKDKEPAILICSDVAKEGHNLQFCQLMIHYDLPYTPAAIGQRNGRIYRRGQEGNPKAYYMLFNIGYDLRLFGDIIVEKCKVIETLEKQEKLSWINILPNDASKYIEECTRKYVEEMLKESVENVITAAKKFLKKRFFDIQIDADGKKEKDNEGNVIQKWTYEVAKNLYDDINDKSGSMTDDEIINKLTSLFKSDEMNSGYTLQEYYKKQYEEQLKKFCKNTLGCGNNCGLDGCSCKPEDIFIKVCSEIVGKMETKYCHNMINDNMSIKEYKQQFKPLKEWERDKNGNDK